MVDGLNIFWRLLLLVQITFLVVFVTSSASISSFHRGDAAALCS
jgi:hypothetical protein